MVQDLSKKENKVTENYHRTEMQREMVIQRLRESGCRITKQRQMLLDVILQEGGVSSGQSENSLCG